MSSTHQDRVAARIPAPLRAQLSELARAHDRSESGELRQAIRLYVAGENPGVSDLLSSPGAVERGGSGSPGPDSPPLADGEKQ
jgi:hypothetical protein